MTRNPFTLPFERLPNTIPIFPLAGAVVMPGAQLPLNIFEPRYLNLVEDALAQHRMFAMVQPDPASGKHGEGVFRTGCAGRISSFTETGDHRLLLTLLGVCRFEIQEELPTLRGYRRVIADWQQFAVDYAPSRLEAPDRNRLLGRLRSYVKAKGLTVAWNEVEEMDDTRLVNTLVSRLPLDAIDKQALIETGSLTGRARVLGALLDVPFTFPGKGAERRH